MLDSLVNITKSALVPLGFAGLGAIAFAESSFFPIPPEIILFPLVLFDPANAVAYAIVATVASTFGSLFGWAIGKKGGKPLLRRFASQKNVKRAEGLFKKYGKWTLIVSGLTPIPYKVFTITAGALNYEPLPEFIAACTLGRGARFFIEALVLSWFGPKLLPFLENYFGWALLAVAAFVLLAWLILQKTQLRLQ